MIDETTSPPTLSDVARHARVSLATADRVVNRRPGVRPATAARVAAAIEALGFERNTGAAELARRARRRIAAILPRGSNPFIARLGRELAAAARGPGSRRFSLVPVEAESFVPERLAEAIEAAAEGADAILAVGLDDERVARAIDAAAARGLPVVTLVSDVPGSRRHRYVGIDNRAAGRTAAALLGRFLGREEARVGVLLGAMALRDHRDRLEAFAEKLAADFPHLTLAGVAEGQDDAALSRTAVAALLERTGPLAAIYSAGAGNAGLAEALRESGTPTLVVAHELTAETRPLVEAGALDALIVQDAGHEARSAVRIALAALDGTALHEDQERIRIEILMKDNLPV